MKLHLLMLVLVIALLASGCSKETPPAPEPPTVTTAASTTIPETTEETEPPYDTTELDAYLASVQEESDALKYYLQYEAMVQFDMNEKSQDLYAIWDEALNYLWGELKAHLPEAEYEPLLAEQRTWIAEKETAMVSAGKEVEGGSMYPQVINSVGAQWTEERVWVLYALLQ